jgi:hypothetical protein
VIEHYYQRNIANPIHYITNGNTAVHMAIAATMHSSASELFNTNQTSQERTKLYWPSLQDHIDACSNFGSFMKWIQMV